MKLTRYTDYALRVLLYLGARPDRLCSISEMAGAYAISQNHLMKVVHDLGKAGFVASVRGRLGGIRLARPPGEIIIGSVVRHTEDGFDLVDCGSCIIAPACGVTGVLSEALARSTTCWRSGSICSVSLHPKRHRLSVDGEGVRPLSL